ncbi:hypothetical protein EJ110_NYTH39889 [Nymphaea thermarum]|nr:hypothetical protein EJ110_NYTH39889 [Nymphaea thermarum]
MAESTSSTVNSNIQVTIIRLTKENYLQWSAPITMGIVVRGRITYVNGRKVEPVGTSVASDTRFLEDNQLKTWIVNSVSSDIQTLILRKRTARDMWVILEEMYGQKKKTVRSHHEGEIVAVAVEHPPSLVSPPPSPVASLPSPLTRVTLPKARTCRFK